MRGLQNNEALAVMIYQDIFSPFNVSYSNTNGVYIVLDQMSHDCQ